MEDDKKELPQRDEVKRNQRKQKKRNAILNTVSNFLDTVIKKPSIWEDYDIASIRDKCYHITSDHSRYPPPLHLCAAAEDEPNKINSHKFELTRGFVKRIFDGEEICVNGGARAPTLQIVNFSSRFRNQFCENTGKESMVNQVTLTLADGDGFVVNCKLASEMQGFSGLLSDMAVLELQQFRTLSFSYHATDTVIQKILLLTKFCLKGNPGKMLTTTSSYVTKEIEYSSSSVKSCHSGSIAAVSRDFDGSNDDESTITIDLPSFQCTGEFCTRYGVKFGQCLTKVVPVDELRMNTILPMNRWLSHTHHELLTNKEKRFVAYGWYAENIYHCCGIGNR